ncbi:MAG: helix-turn-helix transcriptional regulator [Bacteroidales bacterium]|nr:helix-turn-helix transcriptional regulator [Bacteroidales bacterium]MDD4713561.1 helix-turn-helix transcriptional regulator [Bacteroidales bacterium]
MNFRLIQPTPSLSTYIKQYWFLEMEASEGVGERVVPNGYVELTFHFADHLRKIKLTDELQPGIIICGQKTGFFDVRPTGKTSMLSIQFFPHSASLFFDLPISQIANETLDLRDVIGAPAHELEEQLYDLHTLDDKVKYIEDFLLLRLSRKTEYAWGRIYHNILLINQSYGSIMPDRLASEACLSRKQHDRLFKQFVGLSPKKYLKVIRFQYCLFVHQRHPHESLTELAYRSGYYDQSHMINDFRELSGITPHQYFTECEAPYSDYFSK